MAFCIDAEPQWGVGSLLDFESVAAAATVAASKACDAVSLFMFAKKRNGNSNGNGEQCKCSFLFLGILLYWHTLVYLPLLLARSIFYQQKVILYILALGLYW